MAKLPAKHREAFSLINEAHLDEWNETSSTPLTVALMKYRSRLRDWASDARVLDEALTFHSSRWTKTPGLENWVRARVLGAGSLELKALTPKGTSYSDLSAAGERVLRSRGVRARAASYRQALHRTTRAVDELIPILIQVMRLQQSRSESAPPTGQGIGEVGRWSLRSFYCSYRLSRTQFGRVVLFSVFVTLPALFVVATARAGVGATRIHDLFTWPTSRTDVLWAVSVCVYLGVCALMLVGLLLAASSRLRDGGNSQWWLLLLMLPVLGWVLLGCVLGLPSVQFGGARMAR